jgi:hypothetical protein
MAAGGIRGRQRRICNFAKDIDVRQRSFVGQLQIADVLSVQERHLQPRLAMAALPMSALIPPLID